MKEVPIRESLRRSRIGRVFIGTEHDRTTRGNDSAQQLFDLLLRRLGVGPSKLPFQNRALHLLRGPHRATSPKLGLVESVDEV